MDEGMPGRLNGYHRGTEDTKRKKREGKKKQQQKRKKKQRTTTDYTDSRITQIEE
jgi:hypothetical protein